MSLATRSTAAERMDTDCADYDDYARCLADLARVNAMTRTHQPLLAWLARETIGLRSFTLLDVACGHGDLLRQIKRWSLRRGIDATLHGIDLNPWSLRAADAATPADYAIAWHNGDVFAFDPRQPYDFIVSSQFTHHLSDADIVRFLHWMEQYAARGWFIADLHRHWFPYYGFGLLAWAMRWHRFVGYDGRISIARSFLPREWRALVQAAGLDPAAVRIEWHIPFRICVSRRCSPP
ncbi:MAG TPA: methyltransferase domain-containing protein [Acetobacteraceae bacterium]|nr:methyltransferase domain-containing protein [Acetobacteraceae bacterium]